MMLNTNQDSAPLDEIRLEQLGLPVTAVRQADEGIEALAASLSQQGLLEPLLVRPAEGDRYEIIAGARRYQAAQLLNWASLSCQVRPCDPIEAAILRLVENVHRREFTDFEKAQSLLEIRQLTGKPWKEIAARVALTEKYVLHLVALPKLEELVQQTVKAGNISTRTAIALKSLAGPQQVEMADRVLKERLTAEGVRREVRAAKDRSPSRPALDEASLSEAITPDPPAGMARGMVQIYAGIDELKRYVTSEEPMPAEVVDELEALHERLVEVNRLLRKRLYREGRQWWLPHQPRTDTE